MIDKIPTLNHEIFHDSVKRRFFVACGLLILEKLTGAKLSEVFTCFGTLRKMSRQSEGVGVKTKLIKNLMVKA